MPGSGTDTADQLHDPKGLCNVVVSAEIQTAHGIQLSGAGGYQNDGQVKHLLGGVAKGAFDEATAEARFNAWKENKQAGLDALRAKDAEAKKAAEKARLEAEKKVNETIAQKVAEKKAAEAY